MSKEEFLTIVSKELERLEQEKTRAVSQVEYYSGLTRGNDYEKAIIQLKVIEGKIKSIRNLVQLPAYARIQAMSDVEIEEYKKSKIAELESKIKELEAKKVTARETLEKLRAEEQGLIDRSATNALSADELNRARELRSEIQSYGEDDSKYGKFAKIEAEIKATRAEEEQILAMTPKQIKEQLSSKMDVEYALTNAISAAKGSISDLEFLAAVADDPGKTLEMAMLLAQYNQECNHQLDIQENISLRVGNLPVALVEKITGHDYQRATTGDVRQLLLDNLGVSRLLEIIQEYEEEFKKAKASFAEQFTGQKLKNLASISEGEMVIDTSEIDMEFLRQHTDKIGTSKLEELEALVERKDNLSRKFIKTKKTKGEIEQLQKEITKILTSLYRQIIGWYKYQREGMLRTLGLSMPNDQLLLSPRLSSVMSSIDMYEKSIAELKEFFEKIKKKMHDRWQGSEVKKQELAQQMKTLAGKEYEGPMPAYSDSRSRNLDIIVGAQGRVYQRDIVNRVQQEAQNQADMREAELRGITVEQLLEMRKQQASIEQQATTEQGVKRI